MIMKAERQHKEAIYKTLQPKQVGGMLSFVDNRPQASIEAKTINAIQRSSNVLQKRDPIDKELTVGEILTHGSAVNPFLIDRKNPMRGTKDKPDGPAWLAENDEAFSVHATLAMQDYGSKRPGTKLYVHMYKTREKVGLASWDYWQYVPQCVLKAEGVNFNTQNIDKTKAKDINEKDAIDEASTGPVISDDEKKAIVYAYLQDDELSWNSLPAAKRIELKTPGKDGYHIEHDLVLNKPEDILFNSGLDKLDIDKVSTFSVQPSSKKDFLEVLDSGLNAKYEYNPSDISSFKVI